MNASLVGLNDNPIRGDWTYHQHVRDHKADFCVPSKEAIQENKEGQKLN